MKDAELSQFGNLWRLDIDEVEIKGMKQVKSTTFDKALHGKPSGRGRLIVDSITQYGYFHSGWDLVRGQVPGLRFHENRVTVRYNTVENDGSALILLNNVEVDFDHFSLTINQCPANEIIPLPELL